MTNKKPEPLIVQKTLGSPCPVCGKQSYSQNGIHPQCAVKQADAPRQRQLEAERRQARIDLRDHAAVPVKRAVHR